jgi:hypothetical protein
MKARKIVSGATVVALALAGVLMYSGAAHATGGDQVCDNFDTGHLSAEDQKTWEITAPEGKVIVEVCVKAGSENQGDGPEYTEYDPGVASVTISHSTGKNISHYSVKYADIPDEPKVTSLNSPVVKDKCGTADDHYGLPEAPEGVSITRDGKDLIATLAEGYVVNEVPAGWVADGEGVYRYAFNAEQFSDEPCEVTYEPSCLSIIGTQTIVGDGVLTVSGDWDSEYIAIPGNGMTLADIGPGSLLDIDADPIQYVGLHIITAEGPVVFEEEPSYGGNLWSTATWDGVNAGMGYAAFGSMEEFIHLNGDVVVQEIRLLYTHPSASSTTVTSFTIGCTVYEFDPTQTYPVPATFNAPAEGPTCDTAATFATEFLGEPVEENWYEFENVDVYVDRSVAGQVTIYISAHEGYNLSGLSEDWTILSDWEAERIIDLPAALEYQSEDSTAPCYQAPPPPTVVPQPAAPTFFDNCGTEDDTWVVPGNTDTFLYEVVEDGDTVTVTAMLRSETSEWAEGAVTEWSHTFTDEECPVTPPVTPPTTPSTPTPGLAVTGGGDVSPILPIGAAFALILGAAAVVLGKHARQAQQV